MISLRAEELSVLAKYIHSITGIVLDSGKAYLIESRLSGLLRELGCASYGELYYRARADATGVIQRKVVDLITTGETLFFRDNAPFELFRHKLLPEIIDARTRAANGRGPIPIRIWSAACSSGQEAYSLGIAIHETLGDLSRYDVRILGTDIADKAIAAASRGIYSKVEIERGLPATTLQRWFATDPGGWKIRDEVRAMATFRRLNLLEDFSSVGRFDLVYCRNVAIYFSDEDRASVFCRIARQLEPGGILVIGSTESLSGICPQYESRRHLRSIYYQVRDGGAAAAATPKPRVLPPATIPAAPAPQAAADTLVSSPAASPTAMAPTAASAQVAPAPASSAPARWAPAPTTTSPAPSRPRTDAAATPGGAAPSTKPAVTLSLVPKEIAAPPPPHPPLRPAAPALAGRDPLRPLAPPSTSTNPRALRRAA